MSFDDHTYSTHMDEESLEHTDSKTDNFSLVGKILFTYYFMEAEICTRA